MKQEIREIDEIIKELKRHPDYLHSEIFTWTTIIEELNDKLYDDEEYDKFLKKQGRENPKFITFSELTNEHKETIKDNIMCCLTYGYEYSNSIIPNVVSRDEQENLIIKE